MHKTYIGKTCPYCKTPFVEGDTVVFCSACDMPHHLSCWQDNKGCTTFGCTGSIKEIIRNNTDIADTSAEPSKKPIETLYESKEMVFIPGIPIALENTAIIIDRRKDKLFARCTFRSMTNKPIQAVLIELSCQDIWGNTLGEPFLFQYLDLKTNRESQFGQTLPIELADKATRKIYVSVKKILFADGEIVVGTDQFLTMEAPVLLKHHFDNEALSAIYANQTTPKAKFVLASNDAYWRCTCGALNERSDERCHSCKCSREVLTARLDPEYLSAYLADFQTEKKIAAEKAKAAQAEQLRLAQQQTKLDQERKQQESLAAASTQKRGAGKIIAAIIAAVVTIALFCGIVLWGIPYFRYRSACASLEDGDFDKAYQTFVVLDGFMDSRTMADEALYRKGLAALENGQIDEAISIFTQLDDFLDSPQKLSAAQAQKATAEKEAKYQEGIQALNNKQYDTAIEIFTQLSNYADSKEKLAEAKRSKENAAKETRYQEGLTALNNKQYEKAIEIFTELGNYSDSESKLAEAKSKSGIITVYTAQELVDSIASNKKIVLGASYYDLSRVNISGNSYLKKYPYTYVQKGFIIKGVNNLSIEGTAQIVIDELEADVLNFENCSNITLSGLTVGHINPLETYMCEGAVVNLSTCKNVTIKNCKLFGCGSVGITTDDTTGLVVTATDIYDCTYSGVWLNSTTATLTNCNFYDLLRSESVIAIDTSTVTFTNCKFTGNNTTTNDYGDCFIDYRTASKLTFDSCTITGNTFANIASKDAKNVVFKNCDIRNNNGSLTHSGVTYQD